MHSAWVTSCSRIAARSCGNSAASSGKSRWQCESTNISDEHCNYIVCVGRVEARVSPRTLLDRGPGGRASVVLRELHADALRAVALHAFGRDPDHLALDREPVGIVHQRQQHEYFLAERVLPRGRNEDAAALEERHVGRVQRRLLADVERQARPDARRRRFGAAGVPWDPPCWSWLLAKQFAVTDEKRLGDEARLQRMRDQRALPQQCPMIAKQRNRRHRGGQVARTRAAKSALRAAQPPAATRRRSAVHASSQSMRCAQPSRGARSFGAASIHAASATGDSAVRPRQRLQPRRALRLPRRRRPCASAASGAPPACASAVRGDVTPCCSSHASASAIVGPRRRHAPAPAAQRRRHASRLIATTSMR